jgi:hypothetical protein
MNKKISKALAMAKYNNKQKIKQNLKNTKEVLSNIFSVGDLVDQKPITVMSLSFLGGFYILGHQADVSDLKRLAFFAMHQVQSFNPEEIIENMLG